MSLVLRSNFFGCTTQALLWIQMLQANSLVVMRRKYIFSLFDCGQCNGIVYAWLAHGNRFPGQ